jgi:predicted MPP superfamily phosphohydrolase
LTFTRRQFLTVGAAATAGLYGWRIEPHWVEFVERPLPIRGLPKSLVGRTLVQISDVHTGLRVDDDYLIDVFRRVTDLNPDIVVVTGDLVTPHADILPQLEDVYRYFPQGRLATIGVLGNHDYGRGWREYDLADRVVATVASLGLTILRNQVVDVRGLQIVGLDDFWSTRFAPALVMPRLDPDRPSLVLSHNPDTADEPVWDGFEGWILSGHTHGGQCRPPFLPPPLLPVRNRRYTAGEFALSGNRRLYINRGVGHSLKLRLNVRPEVTQFVLTG